LKLDLAQMKLEIFFELLEICRMLPHLQFIHEASQLSIGNYSMESS
jgi:hypothetical protein